MSNRIFISRAFTLNESVPASGRIMHEKPQYKKVFDIMKENA